MSSVVVAGAGLGGLRVAESLRANSFAGSITVVGDEALLPYNRPPLSKEALASGIEVGALEFRRRGETADVDWRLGTPITSTDLVNRSVTLADGSRLTFDGLAVATGIRPRELPIPGPQIGRYRLRTAAEAMVVRERLLAGGAVVVLGAGFIGCEVAATARSMGCEVHVVAIDEEPMVRPLGMLLGKGMRHRHEAHGVHFHLGHSIDAYDGDERITSVCLSDGSRLPADVVIEAVGSVPNVGWLDGNGLDLSDGLLVDHSMRVVGAAAPMVAAGDVARHPNALFGPVARRVEHWAIPTETGRRAGRTLAAVLAGEDPDTTPFAALPSFWSDQYTHQLQSFGMPGLASDVTVVEGEADAPCIAAYSDSSGLVGVVGIDRTTDLLPFRRELLARGPVGT